MPWCVSILTRAEARVLHFEVQDRRILSKFQSSPAPRRGCCKSLEGFDRAWFVSILTRAEARVLQHVWLGKYWSNSVSILTRAEARVLQGYWVI